MKKIFLLMISAVFAGVFTGCSDEAFNEKYIDPSKVTSVSVEKLMTGVFLRARDYSLAGYFRYFGYDSQWLGKYSQTFGFLAGDAMYQPGYAAYVEDQYGKFYECLTQFRKLEETYENLDESEKALNEVFLLASKVHVYDYLVGCLDVYGDMPYSEACRIPITGNIADAYAKFDKAEDLYQMVIGDLKTINERFAAIKEMSQLFGIQDFINKGNLEKWRRYANSLRLRVALRVSSRGGLTEIGKAAIKEVLENPTTYPVVENNDQNIQIKNEGSGELNQEGGSGLGDWVSCRRASNAMISRMQNDARLPLLYTLVKVNKEDATPSVYRGTDPAMEASLQDAYNDIGFSEVRRGGFFWENKNWDHQLISAAEVWFIKAEAFQRGLATGDAETAFKRGITESFKFYFKYEANRTGSAAPRYTIPSDADIAAFANAKWNDTRYVDKEDAIVTQKWINFGILFCREAWNEVRRTGYPSGLVFPATPANQIKAVPNRWRYPAAERNYNPNCPSTDYDNYETKLFWAK